MPNEGRDQESWFDGKPAPDSEPPKGLRDRVLRVGKPEPLVTLRASQGFWVAGNDEGVRTRTLFRDSGDRFSTRLVAIGAGCRLPAPEVTGWRTFLVLDGELVAHGESGSVSDFLTIDDQLSDWWTVGGALILEWAGAGDHNGEVKKGSIKDATVHILGAGIAVRQPEAGNRSLQISVIEADADTVLPEHEHPGIEELYVLAGSCEVEGDLIAVGDYHRARDGSTHKPTRAGPEGCVLVCTVRAPN